MTPRLFAVLGAAALITSIPAVASADDRDDAPRSDGAASTWSATSDEATIVTPDMSYPGSHQVVSRELPPASTAALAWDDARYPTQDEPEETAEPATRTVKREAPPPPQTQLSDEKR